MFLLIGCNNIAESAELRDGMKAVGWLFMEDGGAALKLKKSLAAIVMYVLVVQILPEFSFYAPGLSPSKRQSFVESG